MHIGWQDVCKNIRNAPYVTRWSIQKEDCLECKDQGDTECVPRYEQLTSEGNQGTGKRGGEGGQEQETKHSQAIYKDGEWARSRKGENKSEVKSLAYIHYDIGGVLQAPEIPLAKEIHSHFWYKRDENFITIVSNPVNTENSIPFLCQLHDSQGVH